MPSIRSYMIASIPGDGIGVEVVEQTLRVLRTLESLHGSFVLQFEHFDWSTNTFLKRGEYIPGDAWPLLKACDAILFGAVGSPSKTILSIHKMTIWYLRRSTHVTHRCCRRCITLEPDSPASEEGEYQRPVHDTQGPRFNANVES